MRIGIFGGTFDPVHFGHLILAETCREVLRLDQVLFVPASDPPHKPGARITDGHARADMLRLALSAYPEFIVDRRELLRSGVSFSVDTLDEVARANPGAELFFLMGADSLRDLPTWKQPERIACLATIAVCNRPGVPALDHSQIVSWVGETIADRVFPIAIPGTNLSASDLRQRVVEGRSLRFLTPRAVEEFIARNGLYKEQQK